MVFKVTHGQLTSAWVNTALDLAAGHIQYAYVLNDAMAVLIDIHVTRQSANKTDVKVVYERTALCPKRTSMSSISPRVMPEQARSGATR